MTITQDMLEKAKTAASAEELIKLAESEGITLTEEEAEKYFAFINNEGSLKDEDLEAVSGGKGHPDAKYSAGQRIRFWEVDRYLKATVKSGHWSDLQGAWYYPVKLDPNQKSGSSDVGGDEWTLPLELPVYRTQVL